MPAAFVLGNGRSRLVLELERLRARGPIYGCNALYREFEPDVLVSTDRPISTHIQETGYAKTHRMYTRKPISGLGAHRIPNDFYGFSSGPIAVALAALDRACAIYMIGFDMAPLPGDRFNNVYADTEFYKRSSARPTYTGNWIRQLRQVMKTFPQVTFVRVMGDTTADISDFTGVPNHCVMPMSDFLDRINNLKDL